MRARYRTRPGGLRFPATLQTLGRELFTNPSYRRGRGHRRERRSRLKLLPALGRLCIVWTLPDFPAVPTKVRVIRLILDENGGLRPQLGCSFEQAETFDKIAKLWRCES